MPLSLANSDKSLIITDKAGLLSDVYVVNELPPACVIINGMALGKPITANTFGELADVYCRSAFRHFHGTCKTLDVIFDSYREPTIRVKHENAGQLKLSRYAESSTHILFNYHLPGVKTYQTPGTRIVVTSRRPSK